MSEHLPAEKFGENAEAALADEQLHGALHKVTDLFVDRHRAAVDAVPEWQELRAQASQIKDQTLARLDHYLEQFADNAAQAGAVVHWAPEAEDARRIVREIAAASEAKTVVKAKSMTTEEIHLNAALEADGLDVHETDLGEWIIQLADEVPSHIIVPAIHKTKEQIGALLTAQSGMTPTDDAEEMTAHARGLLRRCFARADLGVTGANFAVAETGSLLVLENEGNIRFTTALPRVHVAVVGIEKVIPRLADLELFLRLLPRSGTGQHLTTYQSLITGPAGPRGAEGPEELHIVLLDAGRSRMLAHPTTRAALRCIRCGACLNNCPVYQQVGGHAYGSVYPGPIGAVITPQLNGLEKNAQLPFASSLCGACRDVCPVKIDIPKLLLHLRADIQEQRPAAAPTSLLERAGFAAWAAAMRSPRLYALCNRVARLGQRLTLRDGRAAGIGRLIKPLVAWTSKRDLRPLADRSFREQWRELDRDERGAP